MSYTEVTCELKSNRFGIKNIDQEGKTIFRAGESVEITCAERYWIFGTKETIKSFTCQENGKWDHEPVCENIRCEVPHDQHVSYPEYYFWGDMKVGARKSYYCLDGYEQKAAVATCTLDGWTPKPLCARRMCAAPNIPNAEIVEGQKPNYNIHSRIKYKCHRGFEPEQPIVITCNDQTIWTGIQQCTGKCGPPPHVDFADTIEMTKDEYDSGEKVEYSCFNIFTLVQHPPYSKYLTCDQGEWRGNIKCLKPCSVSVEEMDERGIELRWRGLEKIFSPHGDRISFRCKRGKSSVGSDLIQTCNDGVMNLPLCE